MNPRCPLSCLLLAYPLSFHRQFGDDVLDALWRRRAEAAADSRSRFVLIVLRDLLFSVPRAWWTHGFRRRRNLRLPVERQSIMSNLLSDVRYAFRRLIHKPGLAVLAVLALSIGIGLTAAMFSIVNGVILKGLPFDEPGELMGISRVNLEEGPSRLIGRASDYLDVIERQSTFDGIAAWWASNANVSPPGDDPQFVPSADVTANLFELLDVQPAIGRAFTADNEVPGSPAVVLVGHQFWTERLGADAAVVGQTLRVNGAEAIVVGVMPEGFLFPFNQQVWQPLQLEQSADRSAGPNSLYFGRLADGVTEAQGQGDLTRIMEQIADEHPDSNAGMSLVIGPYVREIIGYQVPAFLFTMLGAVSLVLVIACANVANLLLARASLRTRDVAVSTALGANRSRVAIQLLMEAGIIAAIGGAIGVGLARLGIGLFNNALLTAGGGIPFWFQISLDLRVLGFVLALTVAATLLSGLIPALRASGMDVNEILKDSSRGGSSLRIGRLSKSLMILEVALSCALLVAASLMVRSIVNLANEDYAFDETGLFISTVSLPPAEYPDPVSQRQFFSELATRLEQLPGVTSATVTTNLPVVGFDNGRFALEGETYQQDRDYPSARIGAVDHHYFDTLAVKVLNGRGITEADDETAQRVVVVNESFVENHFPGESPIGRRLAIRAVLTTGATERNDDIWYTIVGIVPDLFVESQLFVLPPDAIYAPFASGRRAPPRWRCVYPATRWS